MVIEVQFNEKLARIVAALEDIAASLKRLEAKMPDKPPVTAEQLRAALPDPWGNR